MGDGIAQIYGLDGALASELLEFPNGVRGMALNLEEETVGAVILGDANAIKEGDTVKTTGKVVEVPVGQALLGRVVDPLGRPLRLGQHRCIFAAPSSIEYSVWLCRCTKDRIEESIGSSVYGDPLTLLGVSPACVSVSSAGAAAAPLRRPAARSVRRFRAPGS